MYEVSFVYMNTWFTLVGDRDSVFTIMELLKEHSGHVVTGALPKDRINMSKVGTR